MKIKNLPDIRKEYSQSALDPASVHPDPIEQFGKWLEEAIDAEIDEPSAMTLATADAAGRPSARMVLLKGYDKNGFVFFTNYNSRKGREIDANPRAALVLYWKELERQVRIEGVVSRVSDKESDAYFNSRPVESRAGAIVSPQSQVIPNRKAIEQQLDRLLKQELKELVRPAYWGGYRVMPETIEFWQGRPGRLHDRILFTRESRGWKIERLAP